MHKKITDVEFKISFYVRVLLLYFAVFIVLGSMCIYITIQLINMYRKWRRRQDKFKQHTQLDTSEGSGASNFQLLKKSGDNVSDNELYENVKVVEEQSDYDFQNNLKAIVDKYKENVSKSCIKTDIDVDRAFIHKEYDNY
jgi:hypothetical protein